MLRRNFHKCLFLTGAGLLGGTGKARASSQLQKRRLWEVDGLVFSNNFSGARLNDLIRLGEGRYIPVIRPEYSPINPSPWYCFEVTSEQPRVISLCFRIDSLDDNLSPVPCPRPWICSDGKNFALLPKDDWTVADHEGTARIKLTAGRTIISAWPPVTLETCNQWMDQTLALPFASGSTIGLSTEGRPIRELKIGDPTARNFVVILGGQHPPEITSYHGLMAFVDELCSPTEMASSYRRKFQTIVIPMINPDGKHHGHWRGTLSGADPNRDWRTQNMPEIRAVTGRLEKTVVGKGRKTICAIDFHATNADFFYIEPSGGNATHAAFTNRWFSLIEKELNGIKVATKPGEEMGTSRNWLTEVLEAPAYTREFRYNQPEEEVRTKAGAEARALMKLLLEI